MALLMRILASVVGVAAGLEGLAWLFAPRLAARVVEMPLLQDVARSSQLGDVGAFFLGLSGMTLYGAIRGRSAWLHAAALLVLLAAVFRTAAWALHGAPFVAAFVVTELSVTAVLVAAAAGLGETRS